MKHLHSVSVAKADSIYDNNQINDVIGDYVAYLTGSIGALIQQFIANILNQFKPQA